MSNAAPPQKIHQGFTLIELLVVISIIAILSIIGIVVFTGIQQKARNAKISSDFNAIYKNIEIARTLQQKTLVQLAGRGCSECVCRYKPASDCLTTMTSSYSRVTTAPLPTDPWGNPYLWDENEGEACAADCRPDIIYSAGPDGIYVTGGDDTRYVVPLSGLTGCKAPTSWPVTTCR